MEITCVDTKSSSPKAQDKENIKLGKKYIYIFFQFLLSDNIVRVPVELQGQVILVIVELQC